MAQITDQQQTKGNLGGPDLFLAPVGRIDPEKISKHFCNTCEKEFEGAPKIDFESPNEEVAENLVLVERGQYVCSACSSTLAEYREFRKSDEEQDVGMAKPIRAEGEAPEPQAPEPAPQAAAAEPRAADSPVSPIEGLAVFDESAKKLGLAKQVGVDSAQTVVLLITKDDGGETAVPWSKVKTVGEVILLGGADAPRQPADEPGKCSSCGFTNKADAKFCEECGSKL